MLRRLFPRPEDGNACHEPAFDPDLLPKEIRERLKEEEAIADKLHKNEK
jgi:hypothetical protein